MTLTTRYEIFTVTADLLLSTTQIRDSRGEAIEWIEKNGKGEVRYVILPVYTKN